MITKIKHTILVEDEQFTQLVRDHVGGVFEEQVHLRGGALILIDSNNKYLLQYPITEPINFGMSRKTVLTTVELPAEPKARLVELIKDMKK